MGELVVDAQGGSSTGRVLGRTPDSRTVMPLPLQALDGVGEH